MTIIMIATETTIIRKEA